MIPSRDVLGCGDPGRAAQIGVPGTQSFSHPDQN